MRIFRLFQLIFFAGSLLMGGILLHSCWQRNLSEASMEGAPGVDDLEVWGEATDPVETQPSIWDITKRHGSFSTFSQLVELAELEKTFQSDEVITVLAPTDNAFSQLPEGAIKQLLEEKNKPALVELLLNHVIPEVYLSIDLLDGETAATLSGNQLIISRGADIKLSNATVTTADISASNGVVHVVDQVIIAE